MTDQSLRPVETPGNPGCDPVHAQTVTDVRAFPDPLGLTSSQFVPAAKAAGVNAPLALDRYRSFFRRGQADHARWPVAIPPISRTLREESPEGQVTKFCQQVPGQRSAAPRVPMSYLTSQASGGLATHPLPNGRGPLNVGDLDIESVLIPMIGRTGHRTHTLCVSSQVGCAMGCTFCETAQMGLVRSLEAREIVAQWYAAAHWLGQPPSNIVFMGMGEPLDNYENVIQAIAVLIDHDGPHFPVSKITVSTVGRLDGLARLREQLHHTGWHRLNLAVSLNAPSDEIRSKIMPINRAMPMADLRELLADWPIYGGGKLCLEYVLIPGVNDAPEHARQLLDFVEPINRRYREKTGGDSPRCLINLIPYNPRRNSPWPAPAEAEVDRFLQQLLDAGLYAKRRRTKGRQMMGACGQLGTESIRKRRLVVLNEPRG